MIVMINSHNIKYDNDKHIDDNLPAGLAPAREALLPPGRGAAISYNMIHYHII